MSYQKSDKIENFKELISEEKPEDKKFVAFAEDGQNISKQRQRRSEFARKNIHMKTFLIEDNKN